MKTVRLYRKAPNSNSSPNRYRVARKDANFKTVDPDGKVHIPQGDYWTLWVEGEEELGAVYIALWKTILEKYDVVEAHSTES
jgi:hypothetical protein